MQRLFQFYEEHWQAHYCPMNGDDYSVAVLLL